MGRSADDTCAACIMCAPMLPCNVISLNKGRVTWEGGFFYYQKNVKI